MLLKSLLLSLLLVFPALVNAQGTLMGTIASPNTTVPLKNATISLALNQSGVVVGSTALTTSPVYCYTSVSGQIVGVGNPLNGPALATNVLSGSLPLGTYYVVYTSYNGSGESLPSPETSIVLVSAGTVLVTLPAVPPGQTGWKVYFGSTSGAETLQGTTATTSFVRSTPLVSGAALPGSNTSSCQFRFNDTITPYPTKYRVSATDQNGATVPGFGFFAHFTGTTVDVSNGWPTARDIEVRYFTPLISAPLSNASQSVSGPITLNSFQLSSGSVLGTGLATGSKPACSASKGVIYYDTTLQRWQFCQNGAAYQDLGGAAGWQRTAGLISEITITDMVLAGGAASDLQGTGTGNGSIVSRNALLAVNGAANAQSGFLGFASTTMTLASGVTGTQTTGYPLAFRVCPAAGDCSMLGTSEVARFELGGRMLRGVLSTDYVGGASIFGGEIVEVNNVTDAIGVHIAGTGGGTGRGYIRSLHTGIATSKPLALGVDTTDYWFVDPTGVLSNTYTPDNTTSGLLAIDLDQNAPTYVLARNATAGALTYAGFKAVAGASGGANNVEVGVTSTAFTPVSGVGAEKAFIRTSAANGLAIGAATGTINALIGGVSIMTVANTGLSLSIPLKQTAGGTGSSGVANTYVVYSDGTAYQGSANHIWDNTNPKLTVVGGILAQSAVRTNPAAGTFLHAFYDSGADAGNLLSYNYSGAAYKNMKVSALALTLNANGTDIVTLKSGGTVNVRLASIPIYANNAAAIAGGLATGDLYRTNADPDFMAIVH